jgi:hypothetical protein
VLKRLGNVVYWFSFLIAVFPILEGLDSSFVPKQLSESDAELVELYEYRKAIYDSGDERIAATFLEISAEGREIIEARIKSEPIMELDYTMFGGHLGVAVLVLLVGYSLRYIFSGSKNLIPWQD